MEPVLLDRPPVEHHAPWRPPLSQEVLARPKFRQRHRWLWRASWISAGVAATMLGYGGAVAAPVIFAFYFPFERIFHRHRRPLRRPELSTDLAYVALQPVLQIVGLVVAVAIGAVSLAWLPGLLLRPLVTALPPAIVAVLGSIVLDLMLYWAHRIEHEIPVLWRIHAVHHSSRNLDGIAAFRNHPLDGVFAAPAFVFVLAAGVPLRMVGVFAVLQFATGIFAHANVRWRLRPLHKLVMTPDLHHWHHSNEMQAWNTNYAALLPVWDIVFGTYHMPADRRPQRYGIDAPMPSTLTGQLRDPLPAARDAISALWSMARRKRRGMAA